MILQCANVRFLPVTATFSIASTECLMWLHGDFPLENECFFFFNGMLLKISVTLLTKCLSLASILGGGRNRVADSHIPQLTCPHLVGECGGTWTNPHRATRFLSHPGTCAEGWGGDGGL